MAVTHSRKVTILYPTLESALYSLGNFRKNESSLNQLGVFLENFSYRSDQTYLITSGKNIQTKRFAELLEVLGEKIEGFGDWPKSFGHSTTETGEFLIRLGANWDKRRHTSFRFLNFSEGAAFFEWLQTGRWLQELQLVINGFWFDRPTPSNVLVEFVMTKPLNGPIRVDAVYSNLYDEYKKLEKSRAEVLQEPKTTELPCSVEVELF